jgi:hypothetical protein
LALGHQTGNARASSWGAIPTHTHESQLLSRGRRFGPLVADLETRHISCTPQLTLVSSMDSRKRVGFATQTTRKLDLTGVPGFSAIIGAVIS